MKRIEQIEQRVVHANPYLTVFDDEVRFPSGEVGQYLRVVPTTDGLGVVLLALHEGRFGLVSTFRYAIDAFQWALPRGFAHGPDVMGTAAAELEEELGARASNFEVIGHVTPDSGVQATRVAIVVATVSEVGEPLDDSEVAETRWVTPEELWALVDSGQIEDGFTLAALLLHLRHGRSS